MKNLKMIATVPIPWREIVLTCRKCARKLDGGFGPKGRQELRRVLKDGIRAAGRRRQIRVMETGCFGLCPKNAVTLARSSHPGTLSVIPAGTDQEAVLRFLELAGDDAGAGTKKGAGEPAPPS